MMKSERTNRVDGLTAGKRKMKLPLHKGLIKIPLKLRIMERYGMDIKECPYCKEKTLQQLKMFNPWKHTDYGDKSVNNTIYITSIQQKTNGKDEK